MSERVNDEDKLRIHDALENDFPQSHTVATLSSVRSESLDMQAEDDMVLQATEESLNPLGKRTQSISGEDQGTTKGEAHVGGATGSNEGLDYLDEDLTKTSESRETGYVGHNSEIRWLRSVKLQAEHAGAEPRIPRYGPPGSGPEAIIARSDALRERRIHAKQTLQEGSMQHTTDSSFYLDSSNIDIDVVVDPYEVPDPETAEHLFNCYLETVHSSFPLVSDEFHAHRLWRRY